MNLRHASDVLQVSWWISMTCEKPWILMISNMSWSCAPPHHQFAISQRLIPIFICVLPVSHFTCSQSLHSPKLPISHSCRVHFLFPVCLSHPHLCLCPCPWSRVCSRASFLVSFPRLLIALSRLSSLLGRSPLLREASLKNWMILKHLWSGPLVTRSQVPKSCPNEEFSISIRVFSTSISYLPIRAPKTDRKGWRSVMISLTSWDIEEHFDLFGYQVFWCPMVS